MKRNIYTWMGIGFLILLSIQELKAQYDRGLYHMTPVPQTNLSNPSFIPAYQYHFGFPSLSAVYGGFATSGAKYNQIFTLNDRDSMSLNTKSFLAGIGDNNNVHVSAANQWLNGGMRWKKFYFSLSIADIVELNLTYPKSLIELAANGNADFVGQTMSISPYIKGLHYREYALGAAYELNDQWNVGLKAKILFGKSGVETEISNSKLTTTEDYYYLDVVSDFKVNTSVTQNLSDSVDLSFSDYNFTAHNFGLGFDLGGTYKMDDKWTFSASVLDLGYVQFDRWMKSYSSNTSFTYKGIDVNQFDGLSTTEQEQKWKDIEDSLIGLFDVKEESETFRMKLTAKVYLGASYHLTAVDHLGALVRMDMFNRSIVPTFTASYYRQLNSHFGVTANYTLANRSYFNLGLGVVANFKPIQVYLVTDNIYGMIAPDDMKYTNFHLGINFVFPTQQSSRTMIDL
jgi:hypothetical protein